MVHTNMSENDRFDVEKRNGDLLNYSANWQFGGANFTNSAMDSLSMCSPTAAVKGDLVGSSSCSSAPFVESCCSIPWNHSTNSQNLGFFDQTKAKSSSTQGIRRGSPVASSSVVDKRLDIDWDSPNSVSEGAIFLPKAPGILPQILSQFPADSSFIERAARFSSFNGGGFSDIAIPFSIPESFSHYYRSRLAVQGCGEDFTNEVPISELPEDVGRGSFEGSPLKRKVKSESLVMPHDEAKGKIVGSNNESDEAESSGCVGQEEPSTLDGSSAETPAKGLGLKKRRRDSQAFELDLEGTPLILGEVGKENSEIQQNGDQDIIPASNKSTGKQGKPGSQALDAPKEEYIHVRARRGQATNSHSLAERVRREKISERMKFLQDLVPGCSKVTGKAVMLDEIINYVQSLQRQVEFLSMKLATVNPQLELNIEGLLAKDILRSRACSSFKLGFSPDMSINYPRLHPLPPRLVEASLSAMGNNPQPLTTSRPQQPGMWEDELHNVVRMSSFGTSASVGSREFNESLPAEHKIDLR